MTRRYPTTMKRQIPCACGCGALSTPNRMETVRLQYRHGSRQRAGTAFLVMAACAEPYQRELGIEAVLHEFVRQHARGGWLHRFSKTHLLYSLHFSRHERLRGTGGARRAALRRVADWLTPRWLLLLILQRDTGQDNRNALSVA